MAKLIIVGALLAAFYSASFQFLGGPIMQSENKTENKQVIEGWKDPFLEISPKMGLPIIDPRFSSPEEIFGIVCGASSILSTVICCGGKSGSDKKLIIPLHNLDSSFTIGAIKMLLQQEEEILKESFKLYRLNGTLLEDHLTLAQYKIKDDEFLLIVLDSEGGDHHVSDFFGQAAASGIIPKDSNLFEIYDRYNN